MRALSRPIETAPELIALADPTNPLLWVRGDRGCVGIGEALRLRFSGPGRFREAAARWREIAAAAEITDEVNRPGSGLLALGTFAFADESAAESVLIVPRVLLVRDGEHAWLTTVSVIGEDPELADDTEVAAELRELAPVAFREGAFGEAAYLAAVAEATARIDRGDAEKIVLARDLVGSLPAGAELRFPLDRLARRYRDCWTFAVDGLLGASPETLIRSTGGRVSARVLAGTAPRAADPDADRGLRDALLSSDKNQQEHAFAVDSVIAELAPTVAELRRSETPFPLELPNVWHLATDLDAELLGEATAIDLAGALHPTAAIAGTPTPVAVAQIAELEPFDRGRYAGAVGWVDGNGDGEWAIALRCAQVEGRSAREARPITAYAGGGIVSGSDPAAELAETRSKFQPILEAFGAE